MFKSQGPGAGDAEPKKNVLGKSDAERSSDAIARQVIRCELQGSSSATVGDLTVRSPSPVIGMCKALIEAGRDPATPLEVYRDGVLCLRVRSLAEGVDRTSKRPSIAQLACSECGATTNAACNCGKPYVPAGARAAEALAQNPEKSDRAIAAEIGVHHSTVNEVRKKSTVGNPTVPRKGKDGKTRKLPAKRQSVVETVGDLDLPTIEAARTQYLEVMADLSRADRIAEITKLIAALGLRVADFPS